MDQNKEHLLKESLNFIYSFIQNININDIRFLSIVIHQYVEYYIDAILKQKFTHYVEILEDPTHFGFFEKVAILKAFGLFDNNKKLLININIITNIRNYYAHHMDISLGDVIPPMIADKINSMNELGKQTPNKTNPGSIDRFKDRSLSTIVELSHIHEK